jgi:hypothetical protein
MDEKRKWQWRWRGNDDSRTGLSVMLPAYFLQTCHLLPLSALRSTNIPHIFSNIILNHIFECTECAANLLRKHNLDAYPTMLYANSTPTYHAQQFGQRLPCPIPNAMP